MSTEIEAKFIVPDQAAADRIRSLSRLGRFTVRTGSSATVRDEYLDTEARALLSAGYACRRREEGGHTTLGLKSAAEPGDTAAPGGAGIHRREELEATPQRLKELTGDLPLDVLFSLTQLRFVREVVDGERPVAAASLDHVTLSAGSLSRQWRELEIELLPRGTEADLAALAEWVHASLGLEPSRVSKFHRALETLGMSRPGG